MLGLRRCLCLLRPPKPPKSPSCATWRRSSTRSGCTSGPCHGAAKGKNGFKLSLRGYDPQFDYEALLYDLSGRRFNRADPARSLMLAKPTQEVAHGGGLRFDIGSDYYKTIFNWIAAGRAVRRSGHGHGAPPGSRAQGNLHEGAGRSGARQGHRGLRRRRVRATSPALAVVESNVPDVATVADAAVKGARTGEATCWCAIRATLATLPVTVLNPKPGFAWKPLPQNNYIDRAIDAKLQRLKIQPSPLVDDAGFLRRVSLDLTGQLPTPAGGRAPSLARRRRKTKRATLIDKLIASPAFVDHWTLKWGDLLQNSRKYLGEKGAYEFREWIRESIAQNKPYDRMVREMLDRARQLLRESRGQFLPRDPRSQAHHGEDHAGLPRRPHGLRAVPRPSLRALDAEPVLRDGARSSPPSGCGRATKWAKRSSTTSARTST